MCTPPSIVLNGAFSFRRIPILPPRRPDHVQHRPQSLGPNPPVQRHSLQPQARPRHRHPRHLLQVRPRSSSYQHHPTENVLPSSAHQVRFRALLICSLADPLDAQMCWCDRRRLRLYGLRCPYRFPRRRRSHWRRQNIGPRRRRIFWRQSRSPCEMGRWFYPLQAKPLHVRMGPRRSGKRIALQQLRRYTRLRRVQRRLAVSPLPCAWLSRQLRTIPRFT